MRYLPLFAALVIMTTKDVSAQVKPIRADVDSAATRVLTELEYQLNDLLMRGDWQSYASYLAEDYWQTTRRGEVRSKQDVIAAMQKRSGPERERTTPDSVRVRVYGDTGVLTAVLTGRADDGGTITFRSRILKTFVRRNGRWYMVAMQGTAIP
ncbi:MAG TPA: nuclear transport factor 2 family protein [Longimicrobiales bacterium]